MAYADKIMNFGDHTMNIALTLLFKSTRQIYKKNMPTHNFFKVTPIKKALTLSLFTGFTILGFNTPIFAQSAAPLVQQSNLVYQGAFRVPQGTTTGTGTFSYGGTSLAFNPANNSLFMIGHDWYQYSVEIKIPAIVNSDNINSLNTATILQSFKDPVEGNLGAINQSDPNAKKIGGQLVYNGNLYIAGYSYYDGAGTQSTSHFVRPLNLSATGQVQGPVKVGNQYPGFVSGYMTQIPSEWQSLFGGPALTGNCGLSIASIQSNGPAASVFDPTTIGKINPVSAVPVVGYPYGHQLGPGGATTNPYYNSATKIRGIVFPTETRSVLFFGRHGVGTYCYGTGTECNDPADNSKGTHAYPYKYQVWAYDANDLLAVKNGTKQQYAIQPYSIWNFNLPFENTSDQHLIGGAAYDAQTNMIYISQQCSDANCTPIIHAFKVQRETTSTLLLAPTNLKSQ